MNAWRRPISPLVIVVLLLAVLGLPAHAQLGGIIKKASPKPAGAVAPPPPPRQTFGAGVTPELVDSLLKALKARAASYEKAQAAEKARKAAEDRINQARGQRQSDALQNQFECEDAAKEKDPRYKEAIRLNELSNAANNKGDEKTAEKYSEQATALNDALDEMVKKLCTGDCSATTMAKDPRNKEVAEKEQAAAREKDPNRKAQLEADAQVVRGMMRIEAEMSCGAMSASKPTTEEESESAAAADAARDNMNSDALRAGQFSEEELARLMELAIGVCGGGTSPATSESKAAIEPRCGELRPALAAAGA